jgi:hypothetical protein
LGLLQASNTRIGLCFAVECRTSPKAPGETGGTGVDAALALDELVQRSETGLYIAAYRITRLHLLGRPFVERVEIEPAARRPTPRHLSHPTSM